MNQQIHQSEHEGETSFSISILSDTQIHDDTDVVHLREQGFVVRTSPNARELSSSIELPDLFIVNLVSACIDHFELVEKIRSKSSRVGILLVLSVENQDDRVRAFMSGADNYILRPYEVEELLAIVGSLARRLGWH